MAGKPEESPLWLAVTRTHADWEPMPPKEADKFSAEQIGWINEWILGGAPWPDEASAQAIAKANEAAWLAEDGVLMKTVGGLSPEWSNRKYKAEGMWAYQPVTKPRPPKSDGNPIDAFLHAQMPGGLVAAPTADRVTLLRRATFDLIGLPPKPEEVEAFVKDLRPDAAAFASVVERLLASPHYGERMAQHWLDVTRYADSSGFANDYERGNAWRYRDYVVRSFNADKRYDQFVREQIAGDEMEPQNPELLIATGFLRMGPWELTGMEVAKVARQRFLDDVTNGVGETFLAQSLQCARCHDHKFDPIPTHDYYSVQAVFATTQLSERAAAFLPVENTQGFEEKKYLEPRRAEYLATLQRLDEMLVKHAERWFVEKGIDPTKWIQAIAQAGPPQRGAKRRDFNGVFDSARNALTKQGVPEDQFPPKFYGFRPEDYGNERVARKGLERLKWELERYEPFAFAVYNGRTPQLTSVSAPLRIWLWHFDQAIAGNPNNFVSTGKKPTHPELLEWLAATFVEQGWSFKALHRSIMNSEAYRRSARHPDPKSLVEKDPTGSSYAVFKPRRLTAEELRDAMLTATGELNPTLGGIPNRPEINLEAALQPRQVMGTFAAAWIPNPLPQQRHRRSLYALKVRGLPDPLQEIFNAPAPDFSCERREASTVTPQVFSLFNGQTTHSRALALANRSVKETKSDDEALTHIFQLVFSRPPQPSERQHCLAHWREIESLISNEIPPTQKPPLEVRRDAVEENTGEKFSFNEKLHANTEFVSDLQPADVPTHTRALADVCLALLNANEFAYVY